MSGRDYIGTLPGNFAVDSDGGATYSIPIQVPPGTAGMAPCLALAYNSGEGNDLVGMGWSLHGLSAIARCPATQAQDGFTGRVSYDSFDRFSLDGQRLVAVDGEYGAADAIYRTEIESWVRVEPVYGEGWEGSGPEAWVLTAKDGTRHEYGMSADSSIAASSVAPANPSIRLWALNRIVDLQGNSLTVSYRQDTTGNALYPLRIDYTENQAAGLTSRRAVTFDYEARPPGPDAPPRYLGGYGVAIAQRLSRIQTWVDGSVVTSYGLDYETGAVTGRSRLRSLTLADAEGRALPATSFDWQEIGPQLYEPARPLETTAVEWSDSATFVPLDVDGNGHVDFVHAYGIPVLGGINLGLRLFLAKEDGSGFEAPLEVAVPQLPFGGQLLPADVNGDGCCDLVYALEDGDDLALTVFLAELDSAAGTVNLVAGEANGAGPAGVPLPAQLLPVDVDGDGRADLVCASTVLDSNGNERLGLLVLLSEGSSFTAVTGEPVELPLEPPSGATELVAVDLNGDGMTDLAYGYSDSSSNLALTVLVSDGRGFEQRPEISTGLPYADGSVLLAGDVNGDGFGDLVFGCPNPDGSGELVLYTLLSNGVSFELQPGPAKTDVLAFGGSESPTLLPLESSGNGLIDILIAVRQEERIALALLHSNGTGFDPATVQPPAAAVTPEAVMLPLDLNGSGRTDVVYASPAPGKAGETKLSLAASMATPGHPDLLATITTGLGGRIRMTYGPLTDAGIYTRAGSISSAQLDPLGAFSSAVSGATFTPGGGGNLGLDPGTVGAVAGTRAVDFPKYVLAEYVKEDGRGGAYAYRHRYAGALLDLEGRGWLGFAASEALNLEQGTTAGATYNQLFPLSHTPATATLTRTSDSALMQRLSYSYEERSTAPGTYLVVPIEQRTDFFTFGVLDFTRTQVFGHDEYGNLSSSAESSTNPSSAPCWTFNTYENDPDLWRLGYLIESKITADAEGTELLSWSRTTYDPTTRAMSAQQLWDDQSEAWQTTSFEYDGYGNRVSVTDVSGATTRYEYDGTYRTFPVRIVLPPLESGLSLVSSAEYDPAFGVRIRSTDPNGVTLSQEVDGLGRVTESVGPDPDGKPVTLSARLWASDDGCEIYEETRTRADWAGTGWRWTRNCLDGLGRVYRIVRLGPDGLTPVRVDRAFNGLGQTVEESLPYYEGGTAVTATYSHDAYGRLVESTQPAGGGGETTRTTFSYPSTDTTIQVEAAGSPLARKSTLRYGFYAGKPLLVGSTDANQDEASFGYDPLGRVVSTGDAAASRLFAYDSLGRRVRSTLLSPDRTLLCETFAYDDLARTLTQSNVGAGTMVSRFDPLRRLAERVVDGGSPTAFAYDAADHPNCQGRCARVTLPSGSTYDYGYDAYGNQVETTLTIEGDAYRTIAEFQPNGSVRRLVYPDQATVLTSFNAAGSLVTVAAEGGPSYAEYADYTAFGAPGSVAYGNGTSERYEFDEHGRITALEVTDPAKSALISKAYRWNSLELLEGIDDRLDAANGESFAFDPVGRLAQAIGPYGTKTYRYDGVGNIVLKDGIEYQFDGYQITEGTLDDQVVVSAAYDPAGNMASITRGGVTTTYAYDGERRLLGCGATEFDYDHSGRRLRKRSADGTETFYVSPGYEVVSCPDGGRQHTRYVVGPRGALASVTVVDSEPDPAGAGIPAPGVSYVHGSHIGSTLLQTDGDGNAVTTIGYLPFGELGSVAGADTLRRKFTGKELDEDTGLYYFGARYYDPALGSFITADDRFGGFASRHDGLNAYAYGLNDPTSYTDPTGHFSLNAVRRWFTHHWREVVSFAVDGLLVLGGVAVLVTSPFTGQEYLGQALLGAGIGGLAYNVTQLISHKKFSWKSWGIQVGVGAAVGFAGAGVADGASAAVSSAVEKFGLAGVRGATMIAKGAASALGGGLVSAGGQIIEQAITAGLDHRAMSWADVGWAALIGAASGGLVSGVDDGVAAPLLERTFVEKITPEEIEANEIMAEVLSRRSEMEVDFGGPLADYTEISHPTLFRFLKLAPELGVSWGAATALEEYASSRS
jgi:RHS repeat-associated protein